MRRFGRLGWEVSEVGHGMWGMSGWAGSDDAQSLAALEKSMDLGCNFYDSAWAYGVYTPDRPTNEVKSDRLLGEFISRHSGRQLFTASKIAPRNLQWPAPHNPTLDEMYPRDHVLKQAEEIRNDIGVETVDLLQLHTWDDALAVNDELIDTVATLKKEGICKGIGVSLNTFDASNGIEAVKAGWVDSVQVVYNIFTRDAEDGLLDACVANDVAVIARVPFDEGSLTGTMSRQTTFAPGDFRGGYFGHGNLEATMERVDQLAPLVPQEMTMAQMALAFVLANPAVTTVIPGMRKLRNVESNMASSQITLPDDLLAKLREFRWDRHRDERFAN